MNDLLFDTPWWLPAAIAAIGVVLFYTANKRREDRLRAAGALVVGLALVLVAVSYFVDTDRETAERRTRQLVASFREQDWAAMKSLLHPKASVSVLNSPVSLYNNRDQIVDRAKQAHGDWGFQSVTVTSLDSRQDQTLFTVNINLLSVQEKTMGRPVPSSWQFDWVRTADGWSLQQIRAMEIAGMQGSDVRGMFPAR